MIERFFHFLTGWAQFEILGDAPRFLNLAARSGAGLWGFDRQDGKARARCRAKEYKRLRPLARRCHARLRCVSKGGLPFITRRMWMRKGLLAGAVCGAALYCFLSGFVWGISVSGSETVGDGLVLSAARSGGLYLSAAKSGYSPKLTERHIISQLPQLKWAVVNTDGCFAEIVVGEAEKKPEIAGDERWSNIVATRAGTVLTVQAQQGRPEVSKGDTVEEGDLLISGLYQEKLEPWDPRADRPYKSAGAARGSVTAETYREFTVQVSAVKREMVPTGEVKVNRALTLFGLRVPLGLNIAPQGDWRVCAQHRPLKALGVELPISVERDVFEAMEEQKRELSQEELKEAALLKLREAQKTAIAPGGRVVKEELVYAFPQGMCVLSAKCRCEEEIGVTQEILVNETK